MKFEDRRRQHHLYCVALGQARRAGKIETRPISTPRRAMLLAMPRVLLNFKQNRDAWTVHFIEAADRLSLHPGRTIRRRLNRRSGLRHRLRHRRRRDPRCLLQRCKALHRSRRERPRMGLPLARSALLSRSHLLRSLHAASPAHGPESSPSRRHPRASNRPSGLRQTHANSQPATLYPHRPRRRLRPRRTQYPGQSRHRGCQLTPRSG